MKTVIIKEIRLLNFKGLRDLTVEFDPALTEIYGRNGIGKTSIFDGFTWLLFGKNSEDRKQFGIKTYDEAGNIIPKLPHEVSAVLLVDGEVVTLCRRFNEKWTKKRGSAVEEFVGHEEERLYNNVPCSVKEWNEKIAAITGVTPCLIRCPYGEYDDHVISAIRSMGMEPIQWDVDSLDWKDYV